MPPGIGTKLASTGGLLAVWLLLLCTVVYLLFGAWNSALDTAYKRGYSAAELKQQAQALKAVVPAVQSARAERATQDKRVQVVRKKADEVQKAPVSPGCSFTDADLGLLNGPIDAGNFQLRVHSVTGVSGTGEVH